MECDKGLLPAFGLGFTPHIQGQAGTDLHLCPHPVDTVEQNPRCERNGVIMGKALSLKPCQCGQDTDQEVPMRTPKRLYAQERIIYHPELLTCLHCGDLLVTCHYLAWNKTVQTLEHVLSIATRPSRCPHEACPGSRMRLLSAQAQRMARG